MSSQPDAADGPVWDTPLHRPIRLTDLETSEGDLVIYHPTKRTPDAWLKSDAFCDTYDAR